jgi:ammonia channel protein AmtB
MMCLPLAEFLMGLLCTALTLLPAQIFDGVCWLFLKLRINDPLSAAPMHGFGGLWGVFFTCLLARQEYVQQAHGTSMNVSAGLVDYMQTGK